MNDAVLLITCSSVLVANCVLLVATISISRRSRGDDR